MAENISDLLARWGMSVQMPEFNLLLPVGISFYIFQALGYSIDVYRGNTLTEKTSLLTHCLYRFSPNL